MEGACVSHPYSVRGDGTNKLYKNCNYILKYPLTKEGLRKATSVNKTKRNTFK